MKQKAVCILYGGALKEGAGDAVNRTIQRASTFPGVKKTLLLLKEDSKLPVQFEGLEIIRQSEWTRPLLLETIADAGSDFDLVYYSWADCPLLDASLAGRMCERHLKYKAEYTYADGWPYGLSPEIISPGTAAILSRLDIGCEEAPSRDAIFSVLKGDINSFEIETEISPEDLRPLRISASADSPVNIALMKKLEAAGISDADSFMSLAARPNEELAPLLRSLPAFFAIQTSAACPENCFHRQNKICPYPDSALYKAEKDMSLSDFKRLLDKIEGLSPGAVLDLSLWGEIALHPQRFELIEAASERFPLVVETCGLGWTEGFQRLSARKNLTWIVSLPDTEFGEDTEAAQAALQLFELFPENTYIQAIRLRGNEDNIEKFYRTWLARLKERGIGNRAIIIQKYDDFCGLLEKRQASDLSPVERLPCRHLQRDMNILADGSVPRCREILGSAEEQKIVGNVFKQDLKQLWEAYSLDETGPGTRCDEDYTFNF
jgi:spiro-SPASM protein